MKNLIIILEVLFFGTSLNSKLNAIPADSCLKMIIPDEPENWFINPNSIRVDSCIGSQTYGEMFAKKFYYCKINVGNYPLSNQLHADSIATIDDFLPSQSSFKMKMQQMETKYGKIYFQGRDYLEEDSIFLLNPGFRLRFDNYNNIDSVTADFLLNITEINAISHGKNWKILVGIENNEYHNFIEEYITPNPVMNYLEIHRLSSFKLERIKIYSITGEQLIDTEFSELVDVSNLKSGIYFVNIKNKYFKFIKQ